MIGDSIVDEYAYVTPLGMSAKEPILVVRADESQRFEGGVRAAERHVGEFCGEVGVWRGDYRTIKRRFVEKQYLKKLFEVHEQEYDAPGYEQLPLHTWDIVIATDFGHGCITPEIIGKLTDEVNYLAINAQTNSANRGFNLITKYPRADYVVIDGLEARLAAQDRDSPIEDVIHKLGFPKIVVTLGKDGAVGYDGQFHYSQAIANKVVDTMGAGDAFLAVTAPFACAGATMPELLAIGNAAGAIKCESVGQKAVTKEALCRIIAG